VNERASCLLPLRHSDEEIEMLLCDVNFTSNCPKCGSPLQGDTCSRCGDSNPGRELRRKRFRFIVFMVLLISALLTGDYWAFKLLKRNKAQTIVLRQQARSERTERLPIYPCIFFTYSAHDGMKALPGVHRCSEFDNPNRDESQELFKVELRQGRLYDRRTDFYLNDTVPIEFERVLRTSGNGKFEFGQSGSHSYDKYLQSRDMHVITVVSNDVSTNLYRTPWWLPFELLDRWVSQERGKHEQMIERVWPYDHLDLELTNKAVESYLVCDDVVVCYLNGYRDANGQELHFERDRRRRLNRLSSPHQWLSFSYDATDRITSISDSQGRNVQYSYNLNGQLVEIAYPTGEVLKYTYDDAQHLLTFSAAPDTKSEAVLLLTNTYDPTSGRLKTQTLADGSTYQYVDTKTDDSSTHLISVIAPGNITYDLDITQWGTILHTHAAAPATSGASSK